MSISHALNHNMLRCDVYIPLLGMYYMLMQVWEVARVIREQRQLNKQRKELWAAHLAAAVDRRPFHAVAQPDGTVSLCRPLEKDVYEREVQQHRNSTTQGKTLKGCFCMHQRSSQQMQAEREEWSRPQAQLIQ